MIKFITGNVQAVLAIGSIALTCFVWIVEMNNLQEDFISHTEFTENLHTGIDARIKALELQNMPPRLGKVEQTVEGIKTEIANIKIELKDTNHTAKETFTLVKELRDVLVYEQLKQAKFLSKKQGE